MSRTIAFLAATQGAASIEEQKACLDPGDQVVLAGRQSFDKLIDRLAQHGIQLGRGDRIKVFHLACIALSTTMLIRAISKILRAGISFEIVSAGLVLEPGAEDKLQVLIEVLDGHYRHVHGIKTHPDAAAPQGRKRLLDPQRLPEIRARLDAPGATATEVARALGVARSTLFNFLDRFDPGRRAGRDEKGK